MDNPYTILGVKPNATADEIKAAYRSLAKRHHPDLNPGKPEAADRFKAIASAYDFLADPERRGRFDRGEIDASGAEKPPERPFYRDFAEAPGRRKYTADAPDFESIFADAFRPRRGGDAAYSLRIDFLEAANGAARRLTLPDGRVLDVTIPAGLRDGQILRLRGQGLSGPGGAAAGDALITVEVAPHPLFRRDGDDIVMTVPITLREAVLGAKIDVPTLKGPVALKIPANSVAGARLRLKGRGIAGGHQYVELAIALSPEPEPELAAFLANWVPLHPIDPRKGMV
jgi:DnaJ-class molecular chaperone